jgi:hypothetical protein
MAGYWFDDVAGDATDNIIIPAACTGAQSSSTGCNNFIFSTLTTPLPASAGTTSTMGAHITCALNSKYSDCEEGFNFAMALDTDGGTQTLSDGGTVPGTTVVQYDISKYAGVTFWALVGPSHDAYATEVKFPDKDTDPRGGLCNADGGTSGCYNHFQQTITLEPTGATWTQNTVYFTGANSLLEIEPYWGVPVTAFDPTTVYGINFQAKGPQAAPDAGGTTLNVDLWIADIAFITQ